MKLLLKDKIIVINGGTKGLGRAVVIAASEEGAKIAFSGRNEKEGRSLVKEVKDVGSEAIFIKADIRKVANCKKLIKSAEDNFGKIDGLVNYAGITTRGTVTEIKEKTFYDILNTNFKSAFFCCKFALKSMLRSKGGSIVNIGSTMAYGGSIDMSAYSCSKGAVLTLTKHIANNYARENIRANWVTMGWVATPNETKLFKSMGHNISWFNEQAKKTMPMGRLQTNEDNVPGILYLLSDYSSQVTGTELHISGGFFPNSANPIP